MNVAIIPARGGSKRIPRKNIREFHGKPIIAYSIAAADRSGLFDGIYVSTEDDEIAALAMAFGAEVIVRPPELAEVGAPDCGTQEIARHALEALGQRPDHACCLYATAPMLNPADLRHGFERMVTLRHWSFVHGWYYWGEAKWFLERRPLHDTENDVDRKRHIDINTLQDWATAEQMARIREALIEDSAHGVWKP